MNAHESATLGDLFRDLQREGLTLLIVEHNIRLMLTYCEAAIVMNFGKLIAAGRPSECIENPAVREAYFGKQSDADRIESLLQLRRN